MSWGRYWLARISVEQSRFGNLIFLTQLLLSSPPPVWFVFDGCVLQPAKKKARRQARQEKAAKMAPRPTQLLRPAVHCPTIKVGVFCLFHMCVWE